MIMGFDNTEFIAGMFLISIAIISTICTVTTLYLIVDMKRRNGYLLLIFNVTLCQLFYELTFFMIPGYKIDAVMQTITLVSTFAGMAVALWTNVISFVLYNIVQYLHSFDIYASYTLFASAIYVPSILLACFCAAYYMIEPEWLIFNEIYYWIRIASILFNIAIHVLISCKLSTMGYQNDSPMKGVDPQQDPVKILASRIKYYPIIQIISRSGAAWYEMQYGFGTEGYSQNTSVIHAVALFMYTICVPSAGIGYFLVFLIVQPAAYNHLKERVSQCLRWATCGAVRLSRDDTRSGSTTNFYQQQSLLGRMEDLDEDELSAHVDQIYGSFQDSSNIRSIFASMDRSEDGYSLTDTSTM